MESMSWEQKWMRLCIEKAQLFSKCAKRQYAALIVDRYNRLIGSGYNGAPSGYPHCTQGACPRYLNNTPSGSPYTDCIANHAEVNAISYTEYTLRREGTLYVNGPPCFECAKTISNSGLKRVCYLPDDSYLNWDKAKFMMEYVGIELTAVEL